MKVLFFMRSTVYVRNFESTLRLLAERGHTVHVFAEGDRSAALEALCREHANVRHSVALAAPFNPWSFLGVELRRALDYLRFFEPLYAEATKLRQRAERKAPRFMRAALQRPAARSMPVRRLLGAVLRLCDRALPRDRAIEAVIRAEAPDLVLVTPLVEPGSPQADYLRSARAAGVRTGLCVYSWDNLTNKGLIQDPLDVVTVWNEAMREEAVRLHGVPRGRIVVTGAAPYDHWFTWQPRETRQAFCARVGLAADRPYLLYLCSSKFIAPDEHTFVCRWVQALRASPALREIGILVRPHPENPDPWQGGVLDGLDRVAVWPRQGADPVDTASRADYFDSIAHSVAVVGINTSAQIESAIIGRTVYAPLAPEFRDTQQGTLHFRHLLEVNGGLVNAAESLAGHVAQLEAAVRAPADDGRCRRFVEAFVRPHGLDVAATPRVVAALEATAAQGPARCDVGPWWAPVIRPWLGIAARRLAGSARGRKQQARCDRRQYLQGRADATARRAARKALKHEVT